jgi:hypothetical protein
MLAPKWVRQPLEGLLAKVGLIKKKTEEEEKVEAG